MKQSKKILSVLLALIMMITIIPLSSITASAETYSGTCGDNLTWTFDDFTGTLTISGTGDMYYYDTRIRPWVVESINAVVIEDGVTKISDHVFEYSTNLTSVTIGDSVTDIGIGAFYSCFKLTSITVDENNKNYSSDKYGVLFNNDKTTLVQYPIGNTRKSYIIPDSVTTISDMAFFHCSKLTSVEIPDSVTTIGGAFSYCTKLTSVEIPDSVITIGDGAFYECSNLASVIIGDNVTTIGEFAFFLCPSLTTLIIGDSLTTIGEGAFIDCSSLTEVYYSGTEEQREQIFVGSYNDYLTAANWHYEVCVKNPNLEGHSFEDYCCIYCQKKENPIKSIEIQDVSIFEGSNGYYHEVGKYFYQAPIFTTVTYKDGTTRKIRDGFEFNDEWNWVETNALEMQYEQPWTAGNTYEVTGTLMGVSDTFNVTIVESPIESIAFEDIILY